MTFKDTAYGDLTGQAYHGDIKLMDINLDSLEGCPNIVFGDFIIYNAGLTSLKGAPTKVSGRVDFGMNSLTSLEFCPEMQDGRSFRCSDNKGLTSLKGGPTGTIDDYGVSNCSLTSFEYSPQKVLGFFNGIGNKVTTLNGCTPYVGGRFFINNNLIEECMFDSTFRPENRAKWVEFDNNPNTRLSMEYTILAGLKDADFINNSEYLKMYMFERYGDESYLSPEIKDVFIF